MKIEKTEKFQTVKPDENMVLTKYNDGDKIEGYVSYRAYMCPLDTDLSILKEISVEKDAEYLKLKKEAIEAIIKSKTIK